MTSNTDLLKMIAMNMAYHIPYILVCVVGGVLAIVKWKTAKSAAPLVLISCLFAIVLQLIWATIYPFISHYQHTHNLTHQQIAWAYKTVGVVTSILGIIPTILLLIAVFAGRQPASTPGNPPVSIR